MTYDKKLFSKLHKQEGGMSVEPNDDATYLVKGLASISFQMPLGGVLELTDILFVPDLKKIIFLVSCMHCLGLFMDMGHMLRKGIKAMDPSLGEQGPL